MANKPFNCSLTHQKKTHANLYLCYVVSIMYSVLCLIFFFFFYLDLAWHTCHVMPKKRHNMLFSFKKKKLKEHAKLLAYFFLSSYIFFRFICFYLNSIELKVQSSSVYLIIIIKYNIIYKYFHILYSNQSLTIFFF